MSVRNADASAKSGTTLVVKAMPRDGEPQLLAYDVRTPSNLIAQDSTASVNARLEPQYVETFTETIERSKGLDSGVSLKFGFGKWHFVLEKKPTSEVKKIQRVIWRKPQDK